MSDRCAVLVTGGAGFIGSHTVELLLQRGHKVRVLDNLSTGSAANLPNCDLLELVQGDIRKPADVIAALDGIEHVLHLAAQVSVSTSITQPGDSAHVNVLGFLNVLEASRSGCVKRFVYSSSAAVYGEPAPDSALTEHACCMPKSPYGLEKRINEQYAQLYAQLHSMACLGLRYFNVYGPRQTADSPYSGVLARFVMQLQQGQELTVYGDGEQTRDFVHASDVAELNYRALLGTCTGVLNVGTGRSCSLNTLAAVLRDLTGQKLVIRQLERRAADIRHSCADTTLLQQALGPMAFVAPSQGLKALLAQSA